jgi:N-methylhydantoinase A
LRLDTAEAARAIVAIAVAKMSLAVRQVSVHQGHDPREFAMVASGGAGPLHGVAVARDLHIPTVIVPNLPSHFSAVGMLLADEVHNRVRTYYAPIDTCDFAAVDRIVEELEREIRTITRNPHAEHTLAFDLRYVGQEFSLTVPVTREQIRYARREEIRRAFDDLHERRYSHHATNEPVEMINIRLVARAKGPKLTMPATVQAPAPCRNRLTFMMSGPAIEAPVYRREQLPAGATVTGPALIEEYGTTTVLYAGDSLAVAATGELVITVGAGR